MRKLLYNIVIVFIFLFTRYLASFTLEKKKFVMPSASSSGNLHYLDIYKRQLHLKESLLGSTEI